MAKKIKEEVENAAEDLQFDGGNDFDIDTEEVSKEVSPIQRAVTYGEPKPKETKAKVKRNTDNLVSCLSNRTVIVRHLPQPGAISDPKHVLYGGLAERSVITLTVPKLRSGTFKNVLTNEEKEFLEAVMGLDPGAMNVYNKVDNFWDNTNENGISNVRLTKFDTRLNLNDPIDYIRYKILLANKDIVAPSIQVLQDSPKATYRFVLIDNGEVNVVAKTKLSNKRKCYMEFGKIENNTDLLIAVIETITGKPVARNSGIDFLQTTAGDLIEADPKLFLSVVQDPLLPARVLIKNCVENAIISKRGDYYYLRSDNTPLCESGEEPTLSVAARYISNPKRQELKLSLEALAGVK